MIMLFSFYSTCKILCNKQLLCSSHILKMSLFNFSVFWDVIRLAWQLLSSSTKSATAFLVSFLWVICLLHQTAHWLIKSRMHKIINRNLSQINKQKTAMEKELIACCEVLKLFYEDWKYFKYWKNIFIISSALLVYINRNRLQITFQKFGVIWKEMEVTCNFNWSQVPHLERRL